MKLLVVLLIYSSISFAEIKAESDTDSRQPELNDACEMALQGKVPYDNKGSTDWADSQIKILCGTAINSSQPAICFSDIMLSEITQGNDKKWEWRYAIQLCKQTLNSQETLKCYFDKVKSQGKINWKEIITDCNSIISTAPIISPVEVAEPLPIQSAPVVQIEKKSAIQKDVSVAPPVKKAVVSTRCEDALQGKISWNYTGSKNWNASNLNRLCKGVEDSIEPSICVDKVMHGGISWGGGTQWKWENAVHLCEGTNNAATTISCFENKITFGDDWEPAVAACQKVGEF